MTHPRESSKEFYLKYFGKFIGKTVSEVIFDQDSDEGDWQDDVIYFGLKFTDGTVAWVNSDEEGNDGGFLDIMGAPDGR